MTLIDNDNDGTLNNQMNKLIIRYSYNTVAYYFMALYNLELQLCYGFIKLRITVAYLESKV